MRKLPLTVMFLVAPAVVLVATLWMTSLLQWGKVDHSGALTVLVLGAELGYLCALSFLLQTKRVRSWVGLEA